VQVHETGQHHRSGFKAVDVLFQCRVDAGLQVAAAAGNEDDGELGDGHGADLF